MTCDSRSAKPYELRGAELIEPRLKVLEDDVIHSIRLFSPP
jgi:hypothetical protein